MKPCYKQWILAGLLLTVFPGTLWASGAVQRRQGLNVHRQVRPVPIKPTVTFEEPLVLPEEPKKPKPKVVLPPTPEQNVLMSSQTQGAIVSPSGSVAVPAAATPASEQSGFYQEMARLFTRMDESSEIWLQIRDPRVKMLTVSRYIELFGQEGARITKPALYYLQLIDNMVRQDPSMLSNPFKNILRVVAIMEYDFDNGTNKDTLARSLLSDQAYIANKRRLGY